MLEPSSGQRVGLCVLLHFVGALAVALPAVAQQHAHTHGHMNLDVAVDAQTITLALESPLEGFLGFERAPRTDAERKRVADLQARLKAADQLFQPDPAGGCRLSKVAIESAVLGFSNGGKKEEHDHNHADSEHADIDVNIVFACDKPAQAQFIDVKLFSAFKRVRTVNAQVATPQGQFKRTLQATMPRLNLTR